MITPLRLLTGLLGTTIALAASCTMDLEGLPESATTGAAAVSGGGSSSASSGGSGSGGAGGSSASSASSSGSAVSSSSTTSTTSSSSASSSSGTGGEGPTITIAGELLVDLDVEDATAGTAIWHNKGSLSGDFKSKGSPTKGLNGGKNSVLFDGKDDAYLGPNSVAVIEGDDDRSIELWVFNPTVDTPEETMVSWANRKPNATGTMLAFNYGSSTSFGAVTHWNQADLPWGSGANSTPPEGQWHHLAYTYDGTTATVFADGTKKNSKAVALDTKAGFSINLAVQREGGAFNLFGSMAIAVVRIHSGALTANEVTTNYNIEKSRFQ